MESPQRRPSACNCELEPAIRKNLAFAIFREERCALQPSLRQHRRAPQIEVPERRRHALRDSSGAC